MPFRMFERPLRGALTLVSAVGIATFAIVPLGSQAALAIPGGPTNTVAPALSTSYAQNGVAITTDNGSWTTSGGAINYTYQWQLCDGGGGNCSDIGGETTNSYTPVGGDVGSTLKAEVFATDNNGTVEHDSNAVSIEDTPVNTVAPGLSGTTTDGELLFLTNGTWTGGSLVPTFRWQRCTALGTGCVTLQGANDAAYLLTSSDVGMRLRGLVTMQNDVDVATKASAVSAVIAAAPPANSVLPSITGVAKNGNTLTEHEGNWDGTAPVTFTYQWRLCDNNGNTCNDIVGETGTTYQVQESDEGSTIRVVVTGHNTAGDVPSTSDPTAVVTTNPPVNTIIPDVEGTSADGNVLTTDNGTWSGLAPITYTYSWLRCDASGNNCNTIGGQTTNEYTLTTTDLGHTIRSSVVAHNADGDSAAAQSHAGDPITAFAPIPGGFLTIAGTAQRGQTLSVDNPTWIGSQPINFTYQWRACDTNGQNCVDIQDATDGTYDLGLADIGTTLRVVVTATNAAGTSSVPSFPSSVVAASVPDAPTNVVATHGDESISVAFDVPFNGGSPLIGFQADCVSSNGGVENTAQGSGSPIVVSGLTNGKDYTCTVQAGNDIGLSALSGPSNQVTPAAAPDAPTLTGISKGDHSLTVTFSDNGTGGAPITDHTAACTSSDGGASGSNSGDSPITIAGLTLHKHYTCIVIATSGVANSDPSDPSDSEVVPSAPDAPTGVSAQRGDSTIRVSFTELNGDDTPPSSNDSPLDGYRATCASSDGGTGNDVFDSGSPIDVGGLTNGKHYTCTVHAINDVGNSVESSASNQVVPDVVPDAPSIDSVTPGDSRISVAFTPGSDNGSDVLHYTADCVSNDGGTENSADDTSSPITVTGLTVGKHYTCTVVATNGAGNSDTSVPSNSVEPASLPQNTVAPNITGSAVAQRTLTIHPGTWTGTPAPGFAYQWQRCDSHGNNCTDINGANGNLRVLSNGDVGHKVRVMVQGTNIAGPVFVPSTPTSVVGGVPQSISGPYFYDGKNMHAAAPGAVGAATHGSSVWVVYPNGNITGPHYAPGNGTLVGVHLAKPIIGIVATPSGKGYWMFASDGGVFAFGDAHFYGSTGAMHLNAPIVSMAATPSGHGYWLFAADGGVFSYGDAVFHGSTGGQNLAHPVVAMLATPSGHGYWLVTSDGQAIRFGDATNIGSVTRLHRTDIVGLVSTGAGYRFVTKTLALLTPS